MKYSEEELRDSAFGYNDELAYAVLDESINAGEFILEHISENKFNFDFGPYLYRTQFNHEFAHLLLGMSFLKHGGNPLPFEYGYNGNVMSEALVLKIQNSLSGIDVPDQSKEDYFINVTDFYRGKRSEDAFNTQVSAILLSRQESLSRIFDMRREYHFDEIQQGITWSDIDPNPLLKTKFNEAVVQEVDLSIPKQVIENFYNDVQSVVKFIQRSYGRLINDKTVDFLNTGSAFKDYLKTIPTSVIWDVINDPKLVDDFDLNHRETLTWEFVFLHDTDFDFFREIAGINNIRNAVGYDQLAKPLDYNQYRLFKDNVHSVKQTLDIVGNGRFVHKQDLGEGYQDFIEKAIAINQQRSQNYMSLSKALVIDGVRSFMTELDRVSAKFTLCIAQKPSSQIESTPSP